MTGSSLLPSGPLLSLKDLLPTLNPILCPHVVGVNHCTVLLLKAKPLFVFVLLFVFFISSSKAHPGPVVHISDNPMDEGKVKKDTRTLLSY